MLQHLDAATSRLSAIEQSASKVTLRLALIEERIQCLPEREKRLALLETAEIERRAQGRLLVMVAGLASAAGAGVMKLISLIGG